MGSDDLTVKQNCVAVGNLYLDKNADGTVTPTPFFDKMDYTMMGVSTAIAVPAAWGQKCMWNGRPVSLWGYGAKSFKANFASWDGFSHMEFINTRTAQLQKIMADAKPVWPTKLNAAFDAYTPQGKQALKTVFDEIVKAPSRADVNRILGETIEVNGRQLPKSRVYKHLIKHLPSEVSTKLQNVTRYNEIYGKVLTDFETAQKTVQSGKGLGHGTLRALHQDLANAQLAENKFITATEGVLGAERKVGVGKLTKLNARRTAGMKKAMAGSKSLRFISRNATKAGGAVATVATVACLGLETYEAAATAKEGEGWKDGTRQLAKSGARAACELSGAWAGAKAGAAIGAFFGPIGAAIGGAVGGIVGWAAGSWLAKKSKFINTSVVQERQEKENKEAQAKLAKAVDEKDLDTIDAYISQFVEFEEYKDEKGNIQERPVMEPVLDAKGNPVKDENGQPVMKSKYITVSEDPKRQKEFEEKIESLGNYVETEATKIERAKELERQAEEARQKKIEAARAEYEEFLSGKRANVLKAQSLYDDYKEGFKPISLYGNTTTASREEKRYSWQDKKWQNSLGDLYDSNALASVRTNMQMQMTPFLGLTA